MVIRAVLHWDDEGKAFFAICSELNYISYCGELKNQAIKLLEKPIPEHLVNTEKNEYSLNHYLS